MNVYRLYLLINVGCAALCFALQPWGTGFWLNAGLAVFNAICFAKTR